MSSSSIPFIESVSVKLPDKSTAILPEATIAYSGYITGMGFAELIGWIDERLAEKGLNDSTASKKALGNVNAIRNIRRKLAWPKIATLKALARVLGDPPPGLFDGPTTKSVISSGQMPSIEELEAELADTLKHAENLQVTISTLKARQKKSG